MDVFTQKIQLFYHLLTLMLFQPCITVLLLWSTKINDFFEKCVFVHEVDGVNVVLVPNDFHFIDRSK